MLFFFCHFNVFVKINEYANLMTSTTYLRIKGLCLSFKMRQGSKM